MWKPSEEIQSLLTLLFVHHSEVFKGLQIDLQGSWLNGAYLVKARLKGANLIGAHLQGVSLFRAHLQGVNLSYARLQKANLIEVRLQGANLSNAFLQEAYLSNAFLQGANLFEVHLQVTSLFRAHLQGVQSQEPDHVSFFPLSQEPDHVSFSRLMERSIGKESNLSGVIFAGGLSQKDVDSFVEDLPDVQAKKSRERLTPHIGQPESNQLPENSGAITGSYTAEEAEKWIAEYEQAMSEVPETIANADPELATRDADIHAATRVPYRLLEEAPDLSTGDPDADNMLIQGDNLEALKALLPFYAGQVKCIYIDPPYNTRSAFEHYDDNLEHSKWLAVMWPRLELLRDLLAEDGSIWVSIDDNEAHYLKVIMDEVFGRKSFVANIVWQKSYTSNQTAKFISDTHDHIFLYATDTNRFSLGKIERTDEQKTSFKNPDNDPRGPWKAENLLRGNFMLLASLK